MTDKKKIWLTLLSVALFFVMVILFSILMRVIKERNPKKSSNLQLPWTQAVTICKQKYKSIPVWGQIKVPNCRKRKEKKHEYIFTWKKPVGIIIKKQSGVTEVKNAVCVVSKQTREITYMELGGKIIVNKKKRKMP